jgi:methionyl-tRNA formyltransferase
MNGVHSPGTIVELANDAMTVACGEGALRVGMVQLEGKNPMRLRDLLNGRPGYFVRGSVLLTAA